MARDEQAAYQNRELRRLHKPQWCSIYQDYAMELIETTEQLEERLSRPTEVALATLRARDGDVLVLGAGGKMGPTLARMFRRGVDALSQKRRVLAVSRFSSPVVAAELKRAAWSRFCATSRIATRFAPCPTRRTSSSWPGRNSVRKNRRG